VQSEMGTGGLNNNFINFIEDGTRIYPVEINYVRKFSFFFLYTSTSTALLRGICAAPEQNLYFYVALKISSHWRNQTDQYIIDSIAMQCKIRCIVCHVAESFTRYIRLTNIKKVFS